MLVDVRRHFPETLIHPRFQGSKSGVPGGVYVFDLIFQGVKLSLYPAKSAIERNAVSITFFHHAHTPRTAAFSADLSLIIKPPRSTVPSEAPTLSVTAASASSRE
jgi:hypothetical protein